MDISLTSGQFNSELFALAANQTFAADASYKTWFTETVTFSSQGVATLSYAPALDANSKPIFWFNGIDDNDTVALDQSDNKKVTVTIVPNTGESGSNTPLTGEVEVTYMTTLTSGADVLYSTNRESVIGEVWMRWPIYSANDDCTDSAVKGYVELHVFRTRVTQGPGFDSSYKSAQTNAVTFSTVDAKLADDAAYSLAYFELEAPESQQNG